MNELPQPLTPAGMDIRKDFRGFILDVPKLLASELAALAEGGEFKAAVLLWARAWHSVPACSLPNDEAALAKLSGAGRDWPRVRAMALRGFTLCSDGRLYHPVLAAEAIQAVRIKELNNRKTGPATEIRRQQRELARLTSDDPGNVGQDVTGDVEPNVTSNVAGNVAGNVTLNVTSHKKEGREEGRKKETLSPPPLAPPGGGSPELVERFLALRAELWPQESGFPAPRLTLAAQAGACCEQAAKAGAGAALLAEIMERGMRASAAAGMSAPGSFKAFRLSFQDGLARHAGADRVRPAVPAAAKSIAQRAREQRQGGGA